MAVRLERAIERYIGDSADQKPRPGITIDDGTTVGANSPPVGSSFLEEDTGRIFRWDGLVWGASPLADERAIALLTEIRDELQNARLEERTGLPVM